MAVDMKPMVCNECKEIVDVFTRVRKNGFLPEESLEEISSVLGLCPECKSNNLTGWDGTQCPRCPGEMVRYNLFEKIMVD